MFQPFKGQWVQSLGCLLSRGSANGTVLYHLLVEAIVLAERAGLKVDGIANDGASWNRAMWDHFGVTEKNVSVEHIVNSTRRLWFFSDFPHLIKCLRNFFSKLDRFDNVWTPNGLVSLKHWYAVLEVERPDMFNLKVNCHLREEHIKPQYYQKMNVALAFQMSRTQPNLGRASPETATSNLMADLQRTKAENPKLFQMLQKSPVQSHQHPKDITRTKSTPNVNKVDETKIYLKMNGKAKKNIGGLSVAAAAENLSRKMILLEGSQSLLVPSLTKKKIKKRPQPLAHSTPIPGASQQLLEAPPPKRPMHKYSAHSQPKAGTSQQLQEAPPPKRPKINLTAPRSTPVSVVKKIKKPETALTNIDLQRRTQHDTISQLGASSSTIELTEKINSLNRRIINVKETNTTINNPLISLENSVKSLDDRTKRMEEMQESMLKMLKDMTKRNSPKARRRPACFPFKLIADLLEFNNSNEELYDDVVNYLAYLGGANLCDEANFYFKNCFEFDADLFRNLSWLGSRIDDVKVSLMSTRFARACEAVINLNKDALEKPTKDKFATAMTKAIKNAKEAYRRKRAAAQNGSRNGPANAQQPRQPPQ
ncbi:uncharacterized protein LOC100115274 isoform X2 [Nasonia vitripennis]|uniref:Transposable element P transposase-like RNase H domain-containing protein n=2 Tax=Nasonia vitripennis TaxID=7425 RepID=A0A7M7QFH1_NASVI|nr:uncharacterized protein LOC100115274 isoform X2 [Nasonia vitripennis]